MDIKSIIAFVPIGIIIIAFIYFNFILPQKTEKEKDQKEENRK